MKTDRFFDHPRIPVVTSLGAGELPVLYRDLSSVLAFFRVDRRRAEEVLSATPFAPVRFATGFAIAGLCFFDYRDCTIGPYRECALMVAAVPRERSAIASPILDLLRPAAQRGVGFHILDLPVTTASADVGGRELWGLPKFLTSIEIELGADNLRCVANAPEGGGPIAVLEGRPGRGVVVPPMQVVLYSVHHGQVLRTLVNARGGMRTSLGDGLTLRIGAGSPSPMSSHLSALGLDQGRPSLVQVCEHGQMVLHAGEPLALARAA